MEELEDIIRAQDPLIVFLSETWSENKDQLERYVVRLNMLAFLLSLVRVGAAGWRFYGNLTMLCGLTTSPRTILM